jgi:tellurite resistance protein TerB
MRGWIDGLRGRLGRFREQAQQRQFADAAMAACALVALSDKDHRLAEVTARDRVLHRLDEETALDLRRAIAAYDRYADLLQTDPHAGRKALLDIVTGLKSDRARAERLIKVCLAIGHSDQRFSAKERAVVEDICECLGLHPGDVGVYDL